MDANVVLDEAQPGLSRKLLTASQKNQLCARTLHTYQQWIAQFLAYNDLSNPVALGESNVKAFLKHIVRKLSLSRARLNQARQAIEFFYAQVLKRPLDGEALALPSS